jgi:outer membrane protein OmpA-like peptidoglycan-associated protein
LIGWISYSARQSHQWSQFVRSLGRHPGIVVTSYGKSGRHWYIHGFRDPLASDPASDLARFGLDSNKANFEFAPFYSLDDEIVTRRAADLLLPPSGVTLVERKGTLTASGVASYAWMAWFYDRAPLLAGVTSVDTSQLRNGEVASLESIVLTFPVRQAVLDSGQLGIIAQAVRDLNAIRQYANHTRQQATVLVVGHTDSSGIESTNQLLSNQRAAAIAAALKRDGIPKEMLIPRGVGTAQPLRAEAGEQAQHFNRSVTFRVRLSPASPAS